MKRSRMRQRSKAMEEVYEGIAGWACDCGHPVPWHFQERGACRACGCKCVHDQVPIRVEGRRAFVARILKGRPWCEAGKRIGKYALAMKSVLNPEVGPFSHQAVVWVRCNVTSVDVHEILTRARGGSILAEDNVLAVCRACHGWISDFPQAALALGLLATGRTPTKGRTT